jgi:hypothetical protein
MKILAVISLAAAVALSAAPASSGEFPVLNMTVAHAWSGTAPCLAPTRWSEAEISHQLAAAVVGAPLADAKVAGFTLQAEPEPLISAFRYLTRRLPSLYGSQSACRDVECAARAMFGREVGPRLLLLATVYRYNASASGADATRPWTVSELDELLAGFGDLPAWLFPLEDFGYRALVYRRGPVDPRSGLAFEVAARSGEGSDGIVFAQGWVKTSPTERRAIIVHELAHEFTRVQGRTFNWREPWAAAVAADARAAGASGQPSMASAYALKNLDEDFAESVTAYRYMAPLLKRRGPARYAILRAWMFGGVEYGAATKCLAAVARFERVRAEAGDRLPVIQGDAAQQIADARR